MNYFYFDESIHERGGFIVGAYIYGHDADPGVARALRACGLQPGVDEFKSSALMAQHPEQLALRDHLFDLLRQYRLGVLVMASEARGSLGGEALRALDQIARSNSLTKVGLTASFDEGIFSSINQALELSAALKIDGYCEVRPEQDSRIVMGIQLADLAAHTCATMLLESLGLVRKHVKAGPNSGYDPYLNLELGFELWARLRYRFFFAGPVDGRDEMYQGALVNVGTNGLYIAETCSEHLRAVADERFGRLYLGCIH
jgi:hypothetical protein